MTYRPSAPVMDSFVRDDTVGGLGRNIFGVEWAEQVGTLGDTAVVKGRAAAVNFSPTGSSAMVKSLTLNNDVEVAATVLNPSVAVNSDFSVFMCVAGATNAARTGYELRLNGFGPYSMEIYKYTTGTAALLNSANLTFDPASGDQLVFVRRGIGLYGYLNRNGNNVLYVATTDAAYTSGSVGLGVAGVARLTDFRFGPATPDPLAPKTSLLDKFVRADENPLSGNWTAPAYDFGGSTEYPALVSNTLRARGDFFRNSGAIWNRDLFGYNQEVWATIGAWSTNAASVGFLMRVKFLNTSGNRFYVCKWTLNTGSSSVTSGEGFGGERVSSTLSTFTTMNNPQTPWVPAAGDQVMARLSGAELQMFYRSMALGEWRQSWNHKSDIRNYGELAGGGYAPLSDRRPSYIGVYLTDGGAGIPGTTTQITEFGGGDFLPTTQDIYFPKLG